jgi:hypothetical protein
MGYDPMPLPMDSRPSSRESVVRSGFGVPLGVELALSTRLCLVPDRGVMLLWPRYAEVGVVFVVSSRWYDDVAV